MGRSVKKGPYVQAKLFQRVQAMNEKGEKIVLKTWSRSSTIFPDFGQQVRLAMQPLRA